jgi:predicted TIM-barrel fold metal-dependent hydrolase
MSFVFSCDAHIQEPRMLFADGMPARFAAYVPNAVRDDRSLALKVGDRIVHKVALGEGSVGRDPRGHSDLGARLGDMEKDGVDGELLFPSLGLLVYFIEDPEAEMHAARVYNDWLIAETASRRHIFVPSAILPARDLSNTIEELHRIAALGYTAAQLPVASPGEVPLYNDERWDPVFALAAKLGIVFTMHTGSGLTKWVFERGPGAAIINYTHQMNDAINATMYLVSGGVLDRNPDAKVVFVESGASWLAAAAERMDEIHDAHNFYVRPKLGRMPSQIIRDQIKCTFQYDRACVMSRSVTGHEALVWGADYPHTEGTWPNSQKVLKDLFEGVDITEREKADIVGGTAARLFRLQRELPLVA